MTAIVLQSLAISGAAAVLATLLGLPLAALLALARFPGRFALVVLVNAMLGLPPVVVGLALYLAAIHAGAPGWLFTPWAIIGAETLLAAPIVAALAHRVLEGNWSLYGRVMQASGASRLRALAHLLAISRRGIATAILGGFGRAISELGAAVVVGGNIAGRTRTMTTAIAHETNQGNLDVALGLALVMIGITVTASTAVLVLTGRKRD